MPVTTYVATGVVHVRYQYVYVYVMKEPGALEPSDPLLERFFAWIAHFFFFKKDVRLVAPQERDRPAARQGKATPRASAFQEEAKKSRKFQWQHRQL